MLRFDKTTYFSLLFKFILYSVLSISLWGSDVLLFLEFINIVSDLYYTFIEFIIVLYFFSNFFCSIQKNIWFNGFHLARFQMYYLILPVQERNLWSICLEVYILSTFSCVGFNGNISLLKALRVHSWPL